MSGADGSATFPALSLTGTYTVSVVEAGLRRRDARRHHAARRRNGDGEGEAARRRRRRPRSPSTAPTQGVRADAQIGRRLDSATIDETPILGRKITTLPLFNSAFRQGKGTGDLFVNATYFITGAGSRRTTTFMLDGASNDEGWGRQTMLATVPVGAVQEVAVLSNAFSAEFGWTAGPGAEHRDQVRHQRAARRRRSTWRRPGGWQAKTFSTDGFCPPSVATCTTPATLDGDQPGGRARRAEPGLRLDRRRRSSRTRRSSSPPPTTRGRIARRSSRRRCRRSCCRRTAASTYVGHYRQKLFNAPARSQADAGADADGARQLRSLLRHQPERRRRRHQRADRGAPVHARLVDGAGQSHGGRSARTCSTKRAFAYLNGDPVTLLGGAGAVDDLHARRIGAVHDRRVARRPTSSATSCSSPTRCRGRAARHNLRFGGSLIHHTTGGTGSEPGHGDRSARSRSSARRPRRSSS